MLGFNYNPIQMGADFTSFHMSELEHEVRAMVDELQFRHRCGPMYLDEVYNAIEALGVEYDELPHSCQIMIDELDII